MINAQALIGTMLGSCTIQKLVGQGGMGAVFLAEQSHPQRQIVIKVLSPATIQTTNQRTLFLERFRQEIKAISSLEQQNIVPIYEYGTQDEFAYIVMPYINGGTLCDIIRHGQQEPLKFSLIVAYLDQMARALDYAHERKIIHRDVRPANVLMTQEGQLLLTDFGLVKIAIERHSSQMRLLKSDTPIGSLEYMAPEQVMGDVIDARTDLYALGIVLYQLVTGRTPFEGGTPIQMATQLVQTPPPSPRQFRTDLPIAAERVMLQALAKRSQDRYARTMDFAGAFRAALTSVGLLQEDVPTNLSAEPHAAQPLAKTRKRGLFDPVWQQSPELSPTQINGAMLQHSPLITTVIPNTPINPINPITPIPAVPLLATPSDQQNAQEMASPSHPWYGTGNMSLATPKDQPSTQTKPVASTNTTKQTPPSPLARTRLGQKTNLLRATGGPTMVPIAPTSAGAPTTSLIEVPTAKNGIVTAPFTEGQSKLAPSTGTLSTSTAPIIPLEPSAAPPVSPPAHANQLSPRLIGNVTRTLPMTNGAEGTTGALSVPNPLSPFPATNITGTLMIPGSEPGTVKLAGAVKVVQLPVAGQPGRYVTSLLPVLPPVQPPELPIAPPQQTARPKFTRWQKIVALALIVALVCFIPGLFLAIHLRPSQLDKSNLHGEVFTPNWSAIEAVQASATANANAILSDSLTQNIHNWPIANSGNVIYSFENGAYHVLNNYANQGAPQSAPAILPGVIVSGPMVYTLTMDEIKGNDGSINNSFGMILRFTAQTGNSITFYSFEVVNVHGGEYQFWKYDNSKGRAAHPWTSLWRHTFGGEFHQGQGSKNINTFKVVANGKNFTFVVNAKTVGTAQDGSLASGEIGMLVNLRGTEIAFSNLRLTYN